MIRKKRKSYDSFGDRLGEMLRLKPKEGKTFTCSLPQGTFIVTVSPFLSENERRRLNMRGSRSVHIEGYYKSHGITHHFSFSDRDGDGIIGINDDGGIFDSAQFFICEEVSGQPDDFYRLLIDIIFDYLKEEPEVTLY
jgi:hypothetical protein